MAEIGALRDNLRIHQATLLENLDLSPMLSFFLSSSIITSHIEKEIESKPTPHDQIFKFLSILQELPDDKLQRAVAGMSDPERGQPHLGVLIADTHTVMKKQHIDVLNRHDEKLTDCLNLIELLGCLRNGVLMSRDTEIIKTVTTPYDQRRRLLQILKKKPDICFFRFIDALHLTNQPHLAHLLLPPDDSTIENEKMEELWGEIHNREMKQRELQESISCRKSDNEKLTKIVSKKDDEISNMQEQLENKDTDISQLKDTENKQTISLKELRGTLQRMERKMKIVFFGTYIMLTLAMVFSLHGFITRGQVQQETERLDKLRIDVKTNHQNTSLLLQQETERILKLSNDVKMNIENGQRFRKEWQDYLVRMEEKMKRRENVLQQSTRDIEMYHQILDERYSALQMNPHLRPYNVFIPKYINIVDQRSKKVKNMK